MKALSHTHFLRLLREAFFKIALVKVCHKFLIDRPFSLPFICNDNCENAGFFSFAFT